MKIAIFGGSFDPIHKAHEKIVKESLKNLDIDKLTIMPTFLNPFKSEFFAPPSLRLEWIKMVFQDEKKVEVCDFEIQNKRSTSSFESVSFIEKLYKPSKIYFIIGADNLNSLPKWQNYDLLRKKVCFVVASRDDIFVPEELKKLSINVNICSFDLRKNLDKNFISQRIFDSVEKFYKELKMDKNLQTIVDFLDSKKAENIQVFDMRGKDYFVDHVIIATTMGERHSLAILDDLSPILKQLGEEKLHSETTGEWAVVDLGDSLIHLMSNEYRAKYNIESFLNEFEKMRKAEF